MAAKKKSRRRYGAKASEEVERAMREMKQGKLKSGTSGKKVTSRKQAVAIGLSEARRAGGKVPSAAPTCWASSTVIRRVLATFAPLSPSPHEPDVHA